MKRNSEIESESAESRAGEPRRLENLDDIVREISDRRVCAEFKEVLPIERIEVLRQIADRFETTRAFRDSAARAGIKNTEGVLGWSTNLETPAHILKGDVPTEVATAIHEDLHRLTHPETVKELSATPELNDLYEGITEYLTEQAVEDLPGHKSGQCYVEKVEEAQRLIESIGQADLRKYFFENKLREEVLEAIHRLRSEAPHTGRVRRYSAN